MRAARYTRQFERDLRLMQRRGKDVAKLKTVLAALINDEPLPARYRDHARIGTYRGRRECHIEPDRSLIYLSTEDEITFERTGTHSDLLCSLCHVQGQKIR